MKWVSLIFIFLMLVFQDLTAQNRSITHTDRFFLLEQRLGYSTLNEQALQNNTEKEEFPDPKSVMYKSIMIPGWGQIVNKQAWKVPIIYGLFAGIGYYTHHLHTQYTDYRAAYYNSFSENDDFRFGPTPDYLEGVNANQLQSNRNSLRNRRDFMYVVLGLAYGLNIVDSYVFAHMRSFDVSDDLSARTILGPGLMADGSPGISLIFTLQTR
ncbi:DUF5683 domain-containing protein [Rhodohalobacter halophilus]|uniref:DUF5683 domain-containing protein n=1 Tax=Rhodohalobacter halophilus TaxID=1812810 RepID=UPI001FE21675|nr:DUF5683 domain-containing protein [Rhodohalobacter halophilus]